MKRHLIALLTGTAIAAAATLAACGGGGNSAVTPAGSTVTGAPAGTIQSTAGGIKLTLTINRTKKPQKTYAAPRYTGATKRTAKASRRPQYISDSAEGLQISVTSGSSTKTIYADLTTNSTLCTTAGTYETCTINVPTLGASEAIEAIELDQSPTSVTNGYGTGFPTASTVLANTSTTISTALGTTASISFGLNPVFASMYDCGQFDSENVYSVSPSPAPSGVTVAYDDGSTPNRILTTGGYAQTVQGVQYFLDADGDDALIGTPAPSPLPFVDVNGSPGHFTVTSSTQNVELAYYDFTQATPAPTSFSTTATIADTSLLEQYDCIGYQLLLTGQIPASTPATLTYANNLSASTPFTGASSYAFTNTINVVALSQSTNTLNLTYGQSGTVTGTDYNATDGMAAYGVLYNYQNECLDSGGTQQASITPGGISQTTWQQVFTVTAMSNTASCTFYLLDGDYGVLASLTPVTVNITP